MDKFIIEGGRKLYGELKTQTSKNAVLPIIAASVLSTRQINIHQCPRLNDIVTMSQIIKHLGGKADFKGNTLCINCADLKPNLIDPRLSGSIRSSVFILGPLLARFKMAQISYPGGCEIGTRPIDLHIKGLSALGADVTEQDAVLFCRGDNMKSGTIRLSYPSVGATENIMMAAVFCKGTTKIINAAKEPEITDLQNFINAMGGRVSGAGTRVITVEGVSDIGGCDYTPIPDRIYAGTFMAAAAATGGTLRLNGIIREHIAAICKILTRSGCKIEYDKDALTLKSPAVLSAVNKIRTDVYPAFPTDMQPQICAMLLRSAGTTKLEETVFENRFCYTSQLAKLGADITVKDRTAVLKGTKELTAANISAADLRGGAALIIGALAANGTTSIENVRHIDRGYYMIENDLNKLGASVKRITT